MQKADTSTSCLTITRTHSPLQLFVRVLLPLLALSACEKPAPPPPPTPEVVVTGVVQKDVPVFMELVGQTRGSKDVQIRARVEGYLQKRAFTEGSYVEEGTLLYVIDPRPLEATLARARGDLATAKARLEKTRTDVNRFTPLVAEQAISQQELDNARSARDAAEAQVAASQAMVEKAELDLGYTSITSPIAGIVGTTEVDEGALVGRGESTLLTTVSKVDPIYFRAGLSEAEYLRVAKLSKSNGEAAPERAIHLLLADGSTHPQAGAVDVIDRAIDPTTGTLTVQFTFPNPDRILRPGQYGRARFEMETRKGALLVPQRAVQELQNLYSVVVVGADNKVAFRNVKVGPRVENLWVVEEGVQPGDRVVVDGLQRIREGMTVVVKQATDSGADARAAQAPQAGAH